MTLFESLLLGLVQGLTEFLPVSSSGHLALGSHLLALDTPGLGYEVWLHIATLAAVVIALRKEILSLLRGLPSGKGSSRTVAAGLVLGTLPAAAVGLLAGDTVERAFDSPKTVGVGLLFTALVLITTRWLPGKDKPVTVPRALAVGCAQALAILPGVSRSGSTLAAGLATGLPGAEAARFSFLLSIPAILGATLVEAGSLAQLGESSPGALAVGFVAAAVSGYAAIQVVWRVMERGRLWVFAPYCVVVGLLALFLL